jgi:hypothetical protein
MAFSLLFFEALHSGRCCFGKILIGPGVRPLDRARARKIGKLTSPIQDLPSFFRWECPDHTDERLFLCVEHHIPILCALK